jgi:hypothetical protein
MSMKALRSSHRFGYDCRLRGSGGSENFYRRKHEPRPALAIGAEMTTEDTAAILIRAKCQIGILFTGSSRRSTAARSPAAKNRIAHHGTPTLYLVERRGASSHWSFRVRTSPSARTPSSWESCSGRKWEQRIQGDCGRFEATGPEGGFHFVVMSENLACQLLA